MDVPHRDPHTAVVGALSAPPNVVAQPEPVSQVNELVPRALLMSHGPFARDPAAISVLKERESDDRRLYAVSFDDVNASRWFWLVAAERTELGWVAHGVAGGSNGPARRQHATPRPASVGVGPWLNLCGQWGGETFYAGGRLDPAGVEVGRVLLTLTDGSQLEDNGIAGVSLFIGRHGKPPRTVDMYAPDGSLISTRPAH